MSDWVTTITHILQFTGALPASASKKTPQETCEEKGLKAPDNDYHFCVLEENLKIHEKYRETVRRNTMAETERVLGLVDNGQPAPQDDWQRLERDAFSIFRGVASQTDNWLLLEAARKSIYLADLTDDEKQKAEQYNNAVHLLETAQANSDHTVNFDFYRNPWTQTEIIFPVEGYFEIKLTLLQVLNIIDRPRAAKVAKEIDDDLHDPRVLQAQRSNPVSAGGYINRLKLLKGNLALYQNDPDLDDALKAVSESSAWIEEMSRGPLPYTAVPYATVFGMNMKDLEHDRLLALMTTAHLHRRKAEAFHNQDQSSAAAREYEEAAKIFKQVFDSPLATQKYGGFLNMGLEAFFSLLRIAIVTAKDKTEAAKYFDRLVGDWQKIEQRPDFKESIGLLIRQRSLNSLFSEVARINYPDWEEIAGDAQLKLRLPLPAFLLRLALTDNKTIISEIKLSDPPLNTPEARLGTVIKCLKVSDVDKKKLEMVLDWWKQWETK